MESTTTHGICRSSLRVCGLDFLQGFPVCEKATQRRLPAGSGRTRQSFSSSPQDRLSSISKRSEEVSNVRSPDFEPTRWHPGLEGTTAGSGACGRTEDLSDTSSNRRPRASEQAKARGRTGWNSHLPTAANQAVDSLQNSSRRRQPLSPFPIP